MICPHCSATQPDRSKFCNQCGHPIPFLEPTASIPAPMPPKVSPPPSVPVRGVPLRPGAAHKLAAVVLGAVSVFAMGALAVGPKQPCIANHRPLESCPSPGWVNPAIGLIGVLGLGSAAKVWSGKS